MLNIIEIIEKVLFGKMKSVDELSECWPETIVDIDLFENIYNDIESVIEHLSIKENTEIDENLFLKSRDYKYLVIDYKVLNSGFSIELINKLIVEMRTKKISSICKLEKEISKLIHLK